MSEFQGYCPKCGHREDCHANKPCPQCGSTMKITHMDGMTDKDFDRDGEEDV